MLSSRLQYRMNRPKRNILRAGVVHCLILGLYPTQKDRAGTPIKRGQTAPLFSTKSNHRACKMRHEALVDGVFAKWLSVRPPGTFCFLIWSIDKTPCLRKYLEISKYHMPLHAPKIAAKGKSKEKGFNYSLRSITRECLYSYFYRRSAFHNLKSQTASIAINLSTDMARSRSWS